MRVISLIVAALVIFGLFFVQNAQASNVFDFDTKTKIDNSLMEIFSFGQVAHANEGITQIEEKEAIQISEEDVRNKVILAKWKTKQTAKWNNLPSEKFTVNASAYTAAADETGSGKGITASGINVHEGTIACPPEFPFGAKLQIEGYGTYICEDRGGAIKNNKIDIYMKTKAQAFKFGRRNLTAEVVL